MMNQEVQKKDMAIDFSLSPDDISRLSGYEVSNALDRLDMVGVRVHYLRGAYLSKCYYDFHVEGPDYFSSQYPAEDYDEFLKEKGLHEEDAKRIRDDYQFVKGKIDEGVDPSLFFDLRAIDMIKHVRRYMEKTEQLDNPDKTIEVLQIAHSMPNQKEFRKWYTDQTKENPDKIEPDKMTTTQREAWTYRESLKRLKDHAQKPFAPARLVGINECIKIIQDTYEESKTR